MTDKLTVKIFSILATSMDNRNHSSPPPQPHFLFSFLCHRSWLKIWTWNPVLIALTEVTFPDKGSIVWMCQIARLRLLSRLSWTRNMGRPESLNVYGSHTVLLGPWPHRCCHFVIIAGPAGLAEWNRRPLRKFGRLENVKTVEGTQLFWSTMLISWLYTM